MMLMYDSHDLDERYQFNYDQSITYERVLHAYDDPETIKLGTKDQHRGLTFGLALSTYERNKPLHLLRLYLDVFARSYGDMLDHSFITHHLLSVPNAIPLPRGDLVLRVIRRLTSEIREVQTHPKRTLHY